MMQWFRVPGRPVPKGRPRVSYRGGRVITYTPAKTRKFENLVRAYAACSRIERMEGQVGLVFLFRTDSPADLSNLIKSVEDGLIGLGFEDDRQVTAILAVKRRPDGLKEGVEVALMPARAVDRLVEEVFREGDEDATGADSKARRPRPGDTRA